MRKLSAIRNKPIQAHLAENAAIKLEGNRAEQGRPNTFAGLENVEKTAEI
jgi:hypothetical protein